MAQRSQNISNMKATVLHSVAGGSKTEYMKFPQGDTSIRVVSVPVRHDTYKMPNGNGEKFFLEESVPEGITAKPTKTFFMWVIDRTDGVIKLLECGATIYGQLEALSRNEQYKFDNLPPYDITVNRKGEKTETVYTLTPHRNDTELTEAEKEAIAKLEPMEAYIARKKEWEMREMGNAKVEEATPSGDAFAQVFGE